MGNINIHYNNVDDGIKSQIINKFKQKYLNNVEKSNLSYGITDTRTRRIYIRLYDNNIVFDNIQDLIEFVNELNRPFIVDDDNYKIRFVYGLK
jgi:hypothetical protein